MAGSQIERALNLLESLAGAGDVPMQTLAEQLQIPKSATHRMLAELVRLGYVRQDADTSRYRQPPFAPSLIRPSKLAS